MAHPRQQELLAALPAALRDQAIDLSDVGSAEYAFPVECLEQVFRALSASGFVILGGDLWRRNERGFGPSHEGWYADRPGGDVETAWNRFMHVTPDEDGYFATFVVR